MTVGELIERLHAFDLNAKVEMSHRESGYYPDDSTTVHIRIDDVRLNQTRKTVVIE